MNPAELELFLYRHTASETWHLKNPGQLSHVYDKMKQEEFQGEVGYCFDFVNTLQKDLIGMIKESLYIRDQWQGGHPEKRRSVHTGQRCLAQRCQL